MIQLLSTTNNPTTVKLKWDNNIYRYYLTSERDLVKFNYIKTVGGILQATIWLKKNCDSFEKMC